MKKLPTPAFENEIGSEPLEPPVRAYILRAENFDFIAQNGKRKKRQAAKCDWHAKCAGYLEIEGKIEDESLTCAMR